MKDPLPISLVAEYVFCPRGAWLAHVAGAFQSNEFTVEGELLHTRVHAGGTSEREGSGVGSRLHRSGLGWRVMLTSSRTRENTSLWWNTSEARFESGAPT